MRRTLLLSFLGLCLSAHSFADKTVYVNGTKAEKDLAEITFAGDNVVLKYADASTFTLDMEQVEIDFGKDAGVMVNGAEYFSVNTLVDDQISVSGAEIGQSLQIVGADGKVFYAATAEAEDVTIPTSNLTAGAYLLKVGNRTIKFIKK